MKIFNLKNIKTYILTIVNVLKVFAVTFRIFYKNKNSKFIFFYFPVKAYQENIVDIVNLLNKKSDVNAYIVYNSTSTLELNQKKKLFFLVFIFLSFVLFEIFFYQK